MAGLGLYIQVPFCASKCTFCNFSSRVAPNSVFDGYTAAVELEVERLPEILRQAGASESLLKLSIDTVYFGGGTPPILGVERLERVLTGLRKALPWGVPREFTLEATPGSLGPEELNGFRRMGIDRLSIGAQSFSDKELASVGRLHSAQDTIDLVAEARRAGFENLSLDLIAGLPHQTHSSWQESLDTIARLRPEHVSVYLFEIDEKSRLGAEVLKHGSLVQAGHVPDEDYCAEAYETSRRFLKELGYRQYEISNFALPGRESLHNLKYWQFEPYWGFGAGAHSFDGERRWSNAVSPADYTTRLGHGESPIAECRHISREELIEEFFFTGLRQADGIDLAAADRLWSPSEVSRWQPAIEALTRRGLLEQQGKSVRLVESAYVISNEVFQEFIP